MRRFLVILLLVFVNSHPQVFAQVTSDSAVMDSAVVHEVHDSTNSDEKFDLFLAVLAFIGVSIMMGTAIAIIVLVLLIAFAIIALVGIGIFSVSLGAGIYRRSVSTGVQTAFILIAAIIGTFVGIGAAWLSKHLFIFSLSTESTMLVGAIAGLLGGIVAAWGLSRIIRSIFQKFKRG